MPDLNRQVHRMREAKLTGRSATGGPRESEANPQTRPLTQAYKTDSFYGITKPGGATDISMSKPASTANLNRQKPGQLPFRRKK